MPKKILMIFIIILLSETFSYGLERFDIVTTQEIKQLLEQREKKEIDFFLVNTLDEIIFRDLAIPGSINLPWSRVNELYHRLGNNKNKLIITY